MLSLTDQEQSRFWAKVQKSDACWTWTAAKLRSGYGHFTVAGKPVMAHRVSLALVGVDVPKGFDSDHLCRNTSCVRPDHIEVVTHKENVLRGTSPAAVHAKATHCPRGHEYTDQNTLRYDGGRRRCRICTSRRNNKSNKRARARRAD